ASAPPPCRQPAPTRPPSISHISSVQPSPSAPSRYSAGTQQSSKVSSAVSDECIPSFLSMRETWNPGVSFGTRNRENPLWPASLSVLATSRHQLQRLPTVMNVLRPLITYSLP